MFSHLWLFLAGAVLLVPVWWAAGRLQNDNPSSFFRLLCAVGLALFGYIACVNLLGRWLGNSISAVLIYLSLNLILGILLLWRRPKEEFRPIGLLATWRSWLGPLLIAIVVGLPQWVLAVSTPYWDEIASSAIHVTAPNQFAEGIFPPHHNALPGVAIKYHYAFVILSGTVKWLLGVSANVAIDLVSTGLWLFVFLFVFFWLRRIKLSRLAAGWAAFAVLLGGGLSWLYLPRIEDYNSMDKVPGPSQLIHHFDPAKGWFHNLAGAGLAPAQHLRNANGSLSNLPWDIAAQFQQHAVSVGIALTLVALYLFTTWQRRKDLHWPLLAVNMLAFGTLFLGQAVFGTVSAVSAGLCLLFAWIRQRTRARFLDGLIFTIGVSVIALLHGGMLTRGPEYGGGGFVTLRHGFGYSLGGIAGFLNWNIAGFGIPLFLAITALCLHHRRRDPKAPDQEPLFTLLAVFGIFSYLVPQIAFYSSDTYGTEQFTEISKFFFCTHFALALLSAFGLSYVKSLRRWWILAMCCVASAISPILFCYANSFNEKGKWLGFYHSPYHPNSVEEHMGNALRSLKKTNHDVYFDASADERHHDYLSEMLIFGGSAFTMTPSRYERTGVGFRLAEDPVARRFVQNGRMTRLLPGAPEEAACSWYYSRPRADLASVPVIVRSRFAKLVAEGTFVKKAGVGERALYAIKKPTANLDWGIERYWSPKVIAQTTADCDGDGKGDLIFFDYADKKILCAETEIELPDWVRGEFVNLTVARFADDAKSDFLIGRMKDTYFHLGKRIEDVIERDSWAWTYRRGIDGLWESEYDRWFWDLDIPLVAELEGKGFDSHIAYRLGYRVSLLAPDQTLSGPKLERNLLPIPFAGKFLDGSKADLGLWSLLDGKVTIQSVAGGNKVSFRWGGTDGYVLVPGDYDGDGRDEIAVYNQSDFTWYWRHAPDGPISSAKFGTKTGIPLPWDYNHDGRLDFAYWEPRENKIYVSFNRGQPEHLVEQVVPVPPHSIPAFVNMY